jgi:FlaA1/EpsC-like NDP-sugar epimerase
MGRLSRPLYQIAPMVGWCGRAGASATIEGAFPMEYHNGPDFVKPGATPVPQSGPFGAAAGASNAGKSVLISGAGGSIGTELCHQILACHPRKLVLYELSEGALYTVEAALRPLAAAVGCALVPVLGSVAEEQMVLQTLKTHAVQVVVHAAAYKHVPLMEANPIAGLSNNVFGTQVLARAAARCGVERFVLISSDKAVRPANVMGASKRLAEVVVRDLATRTSGTRFAIVRLGNVLGSSGSVVPLFEDQISKGGPVTVTHPQVRRYFMTLKEAVHLVLHAADMARGGEIFVLDMGPPVRIRDLALQMIAAAARGPKKNPSPECDIEIVFTGLRPGEKLVEELTLTGVWTPTTHPKIFTAQEAALSEIEVAACLESLRRVIAEADAESVRGVLARWVEQGPEAAEPTVTNLSTSLSA